MDLNLKDKAVLLVGGTRGIGRAATRLLTEEGARLAVVARDSMLLEETEAEARAAGVEVVSIAADVTQPKQAEFAVRQAAEALRARRLDSRGGNRFPARLYGYRRGELARSV